jgi:hypothetical protein
VGLTDPICLYEGTKHTFATNAKRRGIEDRLLQRFLGHRDRRSVERDARLADEALVAVLRPLLPTPNGDGLSPRGEAVFQAVEIKREFGGGGGNRTRRRKRRRSRESSTYESDPGRGRGATGKRGSPKERD